MWEKLSDHFVITFISIFFILFVIFPYCGERIASKLVFNNYINKTFGILAKELDVKYKGRFVEEEIRGVHGDIIRWWISGYRVNAPFMEKSFEVWVDKRNYKIFGDNFYSVLANDPKFNHLYSDWVKKQIGINDPNVELIMIFNNSIDFLNIKNKDNILEELFNNIVEYKVTNAYVKNVGINNETDLANYANNIHDIYFTFKKYNEESSGEFNLNDSVILIKEDINFLDKNVRKLGRYLDFPWNIDEKIIEFKDGKIVKIYQH